MTSIREIPLVHCLENDWPNRVASILREAIDGYIAESGKCQLMLTGGVTVQSVYKCWTAQSDFPHGQINYYFGDERCVASDHPDSNYGMVCRTLFPSGMPEYVQIYPMDGNNSNYHGAARCYEALLPGKIDVLLLGMGEDGHVASIFPGANFALEMDRRVMFVMAPKHPPRRLTITPKVITEARTVFLLATGALKGRVLAQVLKEGGATQELPVRYTLSATWLLDKAAGEELYRDSG